ncbi:agmatinase [Sesbania bispinosa]|nr:agmatinase [Sesbania bispinosa]
MEFPTPVKGAVEAVSMTARRKQWLWLGSSADEEDNDVVQEGGDGRVLLYEEAVDIGFHNVATMVRRPWHGGRTAASSDVDLLERQGCDTPWSSLFAISSLEVDHTNIILEGPGGCGRVNRLSMG